MSDTPTTPNLMFKSGVQDRRHRMKFMYNSELHSNILHALVVLPFGMACVVIVLHIAKALG